MNKVLEFDKILNQLEELALTEHAKGMIKKLKPYLSETEWIRNNRDTCEAREILDKIGTPPLTSMMGMTELLIRAKQGGMLLAAELEQMGVYFTGIRRLKDFLNRCKHLEVGLAYESDRLEDFQEIKCSIEEKIRNGFVDDYASHTLKNIRKNICATEEKIKGKVESMLRTHKEYYSEHFIVHRNGHICLPVKKDYKGKISGSVIDKSSTGATVFMEPATVAKLNEQLQILKIEEENEERQILYTLTDQIAEAAEKIEEAVQCIGKIDFIFAKGKLSAVMHAVPAQINTERIIEIEEGYHPLLERETCVPLCFKIGEVRGIVITGSNTGGKTVAIKTIGLLSMMAQAGLHIPCKRANVCMNSQILCDIGDGQSLTQNLSTFSAHITNVLEILKRVNQESLVILDELGSGTDPTEGMGIAIAILEQLKKSGCLFLVTTHYPEVKAYAQNEEGLINARMTFDKENLQPLYQMEIGKAGESYALAIAKRLGMPEKMLWRAEQEAYGTSNYLSKKGEKFVPATCFIQENNTPHIEKRKQHKKISRKAEQFQIGDSVLVYPEKKIGIVAKTTDAKGQLVIQLKGEKVIINYKRLKLHVPASQLYPEDYDFSILFDTVANRKARHRMEKGHQEGLIIEREE